MIIGGATGIYSTSMFRWAGIPNALSNAVTIPGAVIRANSAAIGKATGNAVHGAQKTSANR